MDEGMQTEVLRRLGEIAPLAEQIQGWTLPAAGGILYQMARLLAPIPTVVELGAWKGRSAIWLGYGLRDRGEGKLYSVDTWQGSPGEEQHKNMLAHYGPNQLYEEFLFNIANAGISEVVEPIRMDTLAASKQWPIDRGIGLLLIDASHEYAAVRRDFEFWSPFLVPGGYIVFDDVTSAPGPTQLVSELPRWFRFSNTSPNQWVVRREY